MNHWDNDKKKLRRDHYFKTTRRRATFVIKLNGKQGYLKRRERGYGGRYVFTLVKDQSATWTLEQMQSVIRYMRANGDRISIVRREGGNYKKLFHNLKQQRNLKERARIKKDVAERDIKYIKGRIQRMLEEIEREKKRLEPLQKRYTSALRSTMPQYKSEIGALF